MTAGLVRLGEGLYRDHCAACHGADLEGETPDWQVRDEDGYLPGPPHDETGHTWHHPDQLLFDITKYGIAEAANLPDYPTRMPAFEGVLRTRRSSPSCPSSSRAGPSVSGNVMMN
jgi:S-disulfanyl-L-cysteine oxidoreductase SoxD